MSERKCPMDCGQCTFRQNVYCAAQIGLSNYEAIKGLMEKVSVIEGKLETLQADALLIDPTAQFGEVAQKIDSQDKQK